MNIGGPAEAAKAPPKIMNLDSPKEEWNKLQDKIKGTNCGGEVKDLCEAEGANCKLK